MVGGSRSKRSPVWDYFSRQRDGGKCNLCQTSCQGKGGNTSNLLKHLRLKHNINLKPCLMFEPLKTPEKLGNSGQPDQVSVGQSTSATASEEQLPPLPTLEPLPQTPLKAPVGQKPSTQVTLGQLASLKRKKMTKDEREKIGRAVTRFIVKDMQPFSVISSEPFRRMLSELNPQYQPPNKETISSIYIPAWYNVEMEKLKKDLSDVSAVGLTADHWTSLNGDHYLTVTAQFVKDWILVNKVLETRAVYDSQTGEAISSEIQECLTKFGISEKVVGITVDNAANMAASANLLNILRIPCFAHSMNIAASKLYNDTNFTRWLARIRSVVLWFKRVHMAGVVLKEKLAALELPNHSVILDVKTRWNSMYLMVERFAEIYPGLSAASRDPRIKKRVEKEKIERISDEDLKKSEEFVECMKILYTSTLAISSDKLPTAGQVQPTWMKLEKSFAVKDDDSAFVKAVKTAVWKDMQKRYQQPDVVHFLEEASALDPRFKAKMSQNNAVWERLEAKVADLILSQRPPDEEVQIKKEPMESSDSTTTASVAESASNLPEPAVSSTEDCLEVERPNLKRKRSAIEELFDDDDDIIITQVEAPPTPQAQAHLQVEYYKGMPGLKMDRSPLEFYKTHSEKFPTVAALAQRYFSVSGSSVPSERIFSLAGSTISQERVRIDPEKADMLIFLHKNAD